MLLSFTTEVGVETLTTEHQTTNPPVAAQDAFVGVNTRLESDKGIDSSLSGTTGGKIDTTHARTQIPRTLSAIELSWARCLSPWSRFHCIGESQASIGFWGGFTPLSSSARLTETPSLICTYSCCWLRPWKGRMPPRRYGKCWRLARHCRL